VCAVQRLSAKRDFYRNYVEIQDTLTRGLAALDKLGLYDRGRAACKPGFGLDPSLLKRVIKDAYVREFLASVIAERF